MSDANCKQRSIKEDKSIKVWFLRPTEAWNALPQEKQNDDEEEDELAGFGYCELHGLVDEGTYCWKGCWGCHMFVAGKKFPYVFVNEVAEKLAVSETTVRKMLRKGELRGEVFVQVRYTGFLPAPRKYHIEKESFETLTLKREAEEVNENGTA